MTETGTLAAFLAARLDEDEAAAKVRCGIFPSPAVEDSGAVWLHIKRAGNAVVAHYLHPAEGYGDMADLRAWADADQGWTQDRVLREVEAKRAILAEHEESNWDIDGSRLCLRCINPYDLAGGKPHQWVFFPCPTLRHLGAIYSAHPDYRQEWAP